MEIKERPITNEQPSWARNKDRFLDLLISSKPWNFENEKDNTAY